MTKYEYRHYLRLDEVTQEALDELCRQLFTTKSNLMRRYIQEGVKKDVQDYAVEAERVMKGIDVLRQVG